MSDPVLSLTVTRSASMSRGGWSEQQVQIPAGGSLLEVLQQLGLSPAYIGILLVNDRHATLDQKIQEGDHVKLLPPVGGG